MATPSHPAVSVVIPVHNGADYLSDAVRSVLAQSYRVAECIVVDDGSSDETPSIAKGFGSDVIYIRQEQSGVARARNSGVARATGALVAFLDHDDAWLPAKVELQVAALAAAPATFMSLCAVTLVDDEGNVGATKRIDPSADLLRGMLFFDGTDTVSCGSTGMFWRDRLVAAGGFDPQLGTSADWDMLFRGLLEGGVALVDESLVRYRVHASNMSRNIGAMESDMRRVYAKAFKDPRLPADLRAQRRYAYACMYRMLAGSYRQSGDTRAAMRLLAQALAKDPRLGPRLARRALARRPSRS